MLLKPHETTSGSLWHAREVELMKMASKSQNVHPRLGLGCAGSGGEVNDLACREVVVTRTAGCEVCERAACVQTR